EHLGYAFIVVVLLVLAGYYGWRQVQALRRLRSAGDLPQEERTYIRHQAWRRLFCCGLMVLLAGMLIGSSVLGLETRASQLIREREAARLNDEPLPTPNSE